jgi:hypothetical protein
MSRPEQEAFGLIFPPAADRLASLEWCCGRLRDRGVTTWVGGRSDAVRRLAATVADAWNVWDLSASAVAGLAAPVPGDGGRPTDVTWAGPPPPGDLGAHLAALEQAGATWCVYAPAPSVAWPVEVERLAAAATGRKLPGRREASG